MSAPQHPHNEKQEADMSAPQHPQNEKDKESTCSLFNWYDVKCTLAKLVFPGSPFSTGNGLQDIDGYLYYPSFICTKEKIMQARQYDWAENDTFLSSYPKSGTHFCASCPKNHKLTALLPRCHKSLWEKKCVTSVWILPSRIMPCLDNVKFLRINFSVCQSPEFQAKKTAALAPKIPYNIPFDETCTPLLRLHGGGL